MGQTRLMHEERTSIGGQVSTLRQTSVIGQTERRTTDKTANILISDVSLSMYDRIAEHDGRQKIVGMKDANTAFIVGLPNTAYISVISFGERAQVQCEMQIVGQNRLGIIKELQKLSPNGATPMCAALSLAYDQCRKVPQGNLIRVFLLTDGLSTDGNPLPVAENLKRNFQNIQIQTIGFGHGDQIDESLLRAIATCSSKGDPFYYHILNAEKLTGLLKRNSRHLYT